MTVGDAMGKQNQVLRTDPIPPDARDGTNLFRRVL
jgi:hypothetical protein